MTMNINNLTWQSICDTLQEKCDENGNIVAPISFELPTIENMGGFNRVLFLTRGKVTGGTANINRTSVLLTEDNGYTATVPSGKIGGTPVGEYSVIGVDTSRIKQPVLGEDTISIEKATSLTTVGTYNTSFIFVGEDRAEVFDVQIVVTIPLSVEHRATTSATSTLHATARHGESLTIDLKPTTYTSQYLYVYGSRAWTLEGVESDKISLTNYTTAYIDYTRITIDKSSTLTSEGITTTTFRVLAENQWVDVTVNVHPIPAKVTGQFIAPPNSEVGANAAGDIYAYIDSATSLIASFYVETPVRLSEPVTVTASIQSSTNGTTWSSQNNLTATCTTEFYNESGQQRYYYKINVSRTQLFTAFLLTAPGAYMFRLNVSVDGNAMTPRLIYLTMQPDVRVYREIGGTQRDFITTTSTTLSANPVNIQKTFALNETQAALDARKIFINESNNESVFIQSTLPTNMYGDDFTVNTADPTSSGASTYWLAFLNKIRMTRHAGTAGTTASGWSSSAIKTEVNKEYVELATGSATALVKLGLEKFPLPIPLLDLFELELRAAFEHYIDGGGGTKGTLQMSLPLSVTLQTPRTFKISPSDITLNETNGYTSFVSVEANDDVNWTLTPGSGLEVSSTSGVGSEMRMVKINPDTFHWGNNDFHTLTLTAESTVDQSTLSETVNVHVERFFPTKNALIPKSTGSLDQTLTNSESVGAWSTSAAFTGVNSLVHFPSIEYAFENGEAHRIRSWSLQSVGASSGQRATRLILSGKTLSGQWKILDDTGVSLTTSAFYLATKPRVDRIVQHCELVDTIRMTAVAVTAASNGNPVLFPKIQVFSGEPIVPEMTNSNTKDGVSIKSSGGNTGYLVFDKKVGGSAIASIGSASWYVNSGGVPLNRVAKNGIIFKVESGDYQSRRYVAVSFPSKKLLGYLYSIDHLSSLDVVNARTPYAASLYFEGRTTSDENATEQGSVAGGWTEIDLISLDKCVGFTDSLPSNQATLDGWAQSVLGITGSDRKSAFLIDEVGQQIIRFKESNNQWENDGTVFTSATDAINEVENRTHYVDFKNMPKMAQFRFTVQSVMNIIAGQVPNEPSVAMPEFQFFGLPDDPINTGNEATVSYLKVFDSKGQMHDILGRNQTLPRRSSSAFCLYVGKPQNHATTGTYANKIYLAVQNANGTMPTSPLSYTVSASPNGFACWEPSNSVAAPTYYEIFIYDTTGKKIILSSGYTGGTA